MWWFHLAAFFLGPVLTGVSLRDDSSVLSLVVSRDTEETLVELRVESRVLSRLRRGVATE